MQVRRFGFARGGNWLMQGFRLYRLNPLALAMNLLLMWLALMFAGVLLMPLAALVLPASIAPWAGQLPLALLLPALSVGMLNACDDLARGRPLSPVRVFTGLKQNRDKLFLLGLLYYAGTLTALGLTSLVDGGLLLEVMHDMRRLDDADVASGSLVRSTLLLIALSVPIMAANWFAPALTGWRGISPVKSAFFSLVACWRNLSAFLGYGLALLACFWLLPSLLATFAAKVSPQIGAIVMLLLPLLLVPALYGSFYAITREVLPDLFDEPDA